MSATARLRDIVDALDCHSDDFLSFLDTETGEVATVSREMLSEAEEGDPDEEPELLAWQRDEWQTARRIVASETFLRLPTQFDIHEWAIMEEFARSLPEGRLRDDLMYALHGTGAFRHFQDRLRRHNQEQAWYDFRAAALRQIAIDWCDENDVKWE